MRFGFFFCRGKVGVHPGVGVGHAHKVGVALRKGSLEMSQREGWEVKGGQSEQSESALTRPGRAPKFKVVTHNFATLLCLFFFFLFFCPQVKLRMPAVFLSAAGFLCDNAVALHRSLLF